MNHLRKILRQLIIFFAFFAITLQILNLLTLLLTNSYKRYDIPILTEPINSDNSKKLFLPIIRLYYEGSFICSGVVISETAVLTAAHCVVGISKSEPDNGLVVSDIFEQFFVPVVVAYYDKLRDVAIIYGNFSFFQTAKVDWSGEFQTILDDKEILACGFPGGDNLYCSKIKYVTNFYFKMLFTAGQIYKGMSGGPVLLKIDEEKDEYVVIGVNSAVYLTYTIIGPIVGVRKYVEY